MSHKTYLKGIGLKDEEADIYLACLRLGLSKVAVIAKEVTIPRTSVYFHIKNLLHKGFLKNILRGKTEYFSAVSPKDILEKEREKVEHFSGIVPALEQFSDLSLPEVQIEHFDTVRGLREFYTMLLDVQCGKDIPILVESKEASEAAIEKLGWGFFGRWYKKVARRGIVTQGVITDDVLPLLKDMPESVKAEARKRNMTIRVVPLEKLPLSISFYLFPPDRSFLIIPQQNSVISVKSAPLFQSLRALYARCLPYGRFMEEI